MQGLPFSLFAIMLALPRRAKQWLNEQGQTHILKALAIASLLIVGLAVLQSGLVQQPFIGEAEAGSPSTWADASWDYCKEVWLQDTAIAGSLSNFPVTIEVDFSGIDASKTQDDGDDIFFALDDGTKLNHEIDGSFDETSTNMFHVNVTSLTDGQNNSIFMYYGNSGAANQENVAGTWNSNYESVYHLSNTNWKDSTSNARDGTGQNSPSISLSGMIGSCVDLDGTSQRISISDWNKPADFTITVWGNSDTDSHGPEGRDRRIYHGGWDGSSVDCSLGLGDVDGDGTEDSWTFKTYDGSNHGVIEQGSFSINTWYYMVGVYDDTNTEYELFQGTTSSSPSSIGTASDATSIADCNNAQQDNIGAADESGNIRRHWDGRIDELRILSKDASSNWITTSYNFQNSPSGSIEVGSEQTSGWANTAPSFNGWQPTTTSLLQPDANISINDQDGNASDVWWYISTDNSTWGDASDHDPSVLNESTSYTVSEADSLDTTYYIKVAANDSHDNATKYWSFMTLASQGNSSGFGGKIVVSSGVANITVSPASLAFGTVNYNTTDNTTGSYFTIWNNGSTAVQVNITVNDTAGWAYDTYSNLGTDIFSMNYTTDDWSTETNIAPADPPSTTLKATLNADDSMTFGLRLHMPTKGTTTSQQSITVWITGEAT